MTKTAENGIVQRVGGRCEPIMCVFKSLSLPSRRTEREDFSPVDFSRDCCVNA